MFRSVVFGYAWRVVCDFCHSCIMSLQIIDISSHFRDLKTTAHLKKCSPNTGLPPHFYCTATTIYPMIEGKISAIPLRAKPIYSTSDGEGQKGAELAWSISDDLKTHAGLENPSPLQVQRKLKYDQYIDLFLLVYESTNTRFII